MWLLCCLVCGGVCDVVLGLSFCGIGFVGYLFIVCV